MRRFLTCLALCTATASMAADPLQLLTQALSKPSRSFRATQTTTLASQGGVVDSVVKLFSNGAGSMRREFAFGGQPAVALLQIGRQSWQRSGSNWLRLPDAVDADAKSAASEIARNYSVTAGPTTRLSGRKVFPISLKPKRDFCPSRKLWVDAATGIVLRDQLFAPDGRLRSSTITDSLHFGPQPRELFAKPASAAVAEQYGPASFRPSASRAEVEKATGRIPAMPAHVPDGFRPVVYGIMTAGSGRKMPAVRFSDGLASFTIFERGQGRYGQQRGNGRRGRGWQGGSRQDQDVPLKSDIQRSVVEVRGRRSFILLGDIAENELRKVADSLK